MIVRNDYQIRFRFLLLINNDFFLFFTAGDKDFNFDKHEFEEIIGRVQTCKIHAMHCKYQFELRTTNINLHIFYDYNKMFNSPQHVFSVC